jgi:hypothetical protein
MARGGKTLGVAVDQEVLDTLTVENSAQIGSETSSLVAFHGSTPTDQVAAITHVGTSVPVAACATFGLTSTQLSALVTGLNSVLTALEEKGIIAS